MLFFSLFYFSFLASVQRYDPTYEATKLHFEDLAKRYGNPIIVLNLIKVLFQIHQLWFSDNNIISILRLFNYFIFVGIFLCWNCLFFMLDPTKLEIFRIFILGVFLANYSQRFWLTLNVFSIGVCCFNCCSRIFCLYALKHC